MSDMPPAMEMALNLSQVMPPEAVAAWMDVPLEVLGGITPGDAIILGRTDEVLALTRSYLNTSFG